MTCLPSKGHGFTQRVHSVFNTMTPMLHTAFIHAVDHNNSLEVVLLDTSCEQGYDCPLSCDPLTWKLTYSTLTLAVEPMWDVLVWPTIDTIT